MKKKVLSLFLALLMVLAVVPVSVLPVFASEKAQGTVTAKKAVNWDDMTAAEKTDAYASLYAPGATGIFLAYNAKEDGTITLDGKGSATWVNLAEDTSIVSALTLNGEIYEFKGADGKDYTTGWQFGDKSIGYDLSYQQSGKVHNVNMSSEMLGNGDNTMELVVLFDGMKIEEGNSPTVGVKAEKWGNIYWKKNYRMRFLHNVATYEAGMTELPATSIINSYSATGDSGNWNCGNRYNVLDNYNDTPVRFYIVEDVLDNGKISVGWDLYGDATTKLVKNVFDKDYVSGYGETMQLFSQTPMEVYAIRTYKRALNAGEIAQNHFADLCAYLGVDVSKLLKLDDAMRATALSVLAAAFADKTLVAANKDEIETAIADIYLELGGSDEEEEGGEELPTHTYEELYVSGMSVLLTAYNPAEDGIVLLNGSGTWANKIEGSMAAAEFVGSVFAYTGLDGESYSTGWKVGNKGVSYDMSWQYASGAHGNKVQHYLAIPSDVLGTDFTIEVIASLTGMQVDDSGKSGKIWDKDKSGGLTEGDMMEFWGDLLLGRNYRLHYKLTQAYAAGVDFLPNCGIYAGYHGDHNQGGGPWFGNMEALANTTGVIGNYFITESVSDGKATVNWQFYNTPATMMHQQALGAQAKDIPAQSSDVMKFFVDIPADVYAIRIYKDKILNESERNQNHFADLCGYYGVSSETIGAILANPVLLTSLSGNFSSVALDSCSKEAIESAVETYLDDLAAAEQAKVYNSLYVGGATVMLNAFGGDVMLAGGKGTWKDAITGEAVGILNGQIIEVGGTIKKVVNGETANQEIFETFVKEFKDASGAPLYRVTTNIWVDKTLGQVANKTFTKGNETYTVTKHETIIEGWNGTAYSAAKKVAFGGWYVAEDGGLTYELPDFFQGTALGGADVHSLYIGQGLEYLPENEYTIEITMNGGYITDTDGYQYTNCNVVAWEGEPGSWVAGAIRLGALNFYNRPGTPTGAQVKGSLANAFVHYSNFSDSSDAHRFGDNLFARNFFQKENSTMTITKAATGDGNYTYNGYVNGIAPFAGFTTGTTTYPKGDKGVIPYIPNADVKTDNYGLSTWNQFTLFNNAPVTVYAVRVYDEVLDAAQLSQNHFADLASYYKLDVSKVLELQLAGDNDTLALIYTASNAYAIGSSSRDELQKMVDDAIAAAEARRETMKYASLYAPGATGIFLAYNAANDGSIVLSGGNGTWINLVDGSTATLVGSTGAFRGLDGQLHVRGWQFGEDGSVGYKTSWQNIGTNYMAFSSDLLGNGDTTLEMIARMDGMHVEEGSATGKYWDKDGSKSLTVDDCPEWWGSLVYGKNIHMYFKHTVVYDGVALPNTLPMSEIYSSYSADGKLTGQWNLASKGGLQAATGMTANYLVTEKQLGEGKVSVNWQIFSNPVTMDFEMVAGGKTMDAFTAYGAQTQLFNAVPANVYAIRTYKRVLTDIELKQNHFADLCAYFKLDIKNLALLGADDMVGLYEAFATYTFENANADELQAILDGTVAELVDSPIRFEGVAGRLEDYAAIRGTFTFSVIEQKILAAKGLEVVDFGALVAIADGVEMSDLTVSFDGTQTTADGVIALVSNLAGMTYNYELDGIGAVYTLSVTYNGLSGDALKAAYETDLIYRGYIILADEDGELYTLYTDGVTETFGDSASMKDVAEKLLENEAYADNEVLGGIIDACTPVPAPEQGGEA